MSKILLANITWNPYGWKNNTYINPKAGHEYAKTHVGGESLNFNFNKKSVDTPKFVHGYVQWKDNPTKFDKGGLIIFYTNNTEIRKGQIVGVFGKAEIVNPVQTLNVSFQKEDYYINIKGERYFSLLFPLPLLANNYKKKSGDRIVGQIGFAYKDEDFAEKVLFDELSALSKAGINEDDFNKLVAIYEFYVEKKFDSDFISNDDKEQQELVKFYKKNKTKEDILKDLQNLKEIDSEEIIVNHKTYKRDNKTIAQIKIVRDFKCQICATSIMKKDGSKYVEAAHIKPKHQKGGETLDNIILLCPNHHKEFDLGRLEIKSHDSARIDFVLNGNRHKIKFQFS